MSNHFCRKYPLDKGMGFLFLMDCLGAVLYSANIVGAIFGLSESQEQYYFETKYAESY